MTEGFISDQLKPSYDQVKKIWQQLLAEYYDSKEKLKSQYIIEVVCHHCGATDHHSEFYLNGFRHVTCSKCNVVYVTPRLKDSCLERLYNDQYYSEIYMQSVIPAFEVRKKMIGQNKVKQLLQYAPVSVGRVLDIGCGVGEVIDVFKDLGWDCQAIEVNPAAVAWVTQRNIKVFNGTFEQYPISEKFDVIMAWGVVEHLTAPDLFLKKVFAQLKSGGIFVSEVPNGQSLLVDYCREEKKDPQRILMGEQHIILYSLSAYEDLHCRNGFEKLHIQTNGFDVETICKIENQALAPAVIAKIQKFIDAYGKGDLIRGIWRKRL